MDPINILVGLVIIASFVANMSGAKKGFKSTITSYKEKPRTYLQTLPLVLSTFTLLAAILGVFQIGTMNYDGTYFSIRVAGLITYIFFSWLQVTAYKSLGKNYSQEIVIFKTHTLVTKGPFKFIRHPQYFSQIIIDLAVSAALLSYIIFPLAVIQIPFIIMRASLEEKMLAKHFSEQFSEYKKKSGFMIPFIG